MTSTITILNDSNQAVIGEIVVENAYIYERINDKYTFEFTCYEQEDTDLLAQSTLIYADSDYFRIASIRETPIQKKFEVSCEHISYELNVITPEEQSENMEEIHYEGRIWEIVGEILEGTRFQWIPSDDNNDTFKFSTKTRGKRSRIIEFCKTFGLEVHWIRFDVAIQTRRGADKGLEIELGENLQDLVINKTFNFNGTITTTYDIDFIDLNKVYDSYGDPLRETDFHMGDTVYLIINGRTVQQRGVAIGYDIFRRELPTIELQSTVKDITEVIADGGTVVSAAAPPIQLPKMKALDVAKDSFVLMNERRVDDVSSTEGKKETLGLLTLPIDEVVSGVVVLNFEMKRITPGATGGERTLIFEVTLDDPLTRNAINNKNLSNSHGRLINAFRYDTFYQIAIPIFIHNNENVKILKEYPLARPYYFIFYRNPDTGRTSTVSIDDTPENQAEIERYRNDPNTLTMEHITTREQYERGDINTGISIVVKDIYNEINTPDFYRLNFHTREDFRIHYPPTKGAVVRLVGTNFNLQPPTSG